MDRAGSRGTTAAWAAAERWQLAEPNDLVAGAAFAPVPAQPTWLNGKLATSYAWMAFDAAGLPNKLFAEQVLQADLGQKVESRQGGIRNITLSRFEDLIRSVLNKENIDLSWPSEHQLRAFLNSESEFIAVT